MSKIEVDAIVPQSGTTLTVGESGDTITIPSGATFDASNATTTLPSTIVTTTGSQTLTNKNIDASQLTGTITPSDNTVSLAKLSATGTKDVFCTIPAKKTISPIMEATGYVVTHASTLDQDQTLDSGVLAGPVSITGTQTVTGTLVII